MQGLSGFAPHIYSVVEARETVSPSRMEDKARPHLLFFCASVIEMIVERDEV